MKTLKLMFNFIYLALEIIKKQSERCLASCGGIEAAVLLTQAPGSKAALGFSAGWPVTWPLEIKLWLVLKGKQQQNFTADVCIIEII